jgi:hypothetical protein
MHPVGGIGNKLEVQESGLEVHFGEPEVQNGFNL